MRQWQVLDNWSFPLVPCVDSGDPWWSYQASQAQCWSHTTLVPGPIPPGSETRAWAPLGQSPGRGLCLCSKSPEWVEIEAGEAGWEPPVPQRFLTTHPPGTQRLRAVETPVPLRDISGQSCGLYVLGGGTRVLRVGQSRGAGSSSLGVGWGHQYPPIQIWRVLIGF